MRRVNEMIVAIYMANQKSMKNSGNSGRLFIAKVAFCVVICIWVIPILGILEDNLHWINISFSKPKSRLLYLPILLMMYFVLNLFTWKIEKVEDFTSENENTDRINNAKKLLLALIIIGFVFLVIVAKYNAGNSLSD